MGKNKSKRKVRTDYAARVSAMQKLDNEMKKQPGHKANGGGNGKRDRGKAES